MPPKLLVVDDDPNARTQMKWALAQDFELFVAQDRPSALAVFRKERPGQVDYLRVLWAWSTGGAWEAHDNPRLAYPTQPVLYKLYVVRAAAEETAAPDDVTADFLHQFLPALRRAVFPGR